MIMPLRCMLEGHGFPQGNQSHPTARAPGTGSFLVAESMAVKKDWAHIRCVPHWRLQAFCAGSLQHFASAEWHATDPLLHSCGDRPAALTMQGLGLGRAPLSGTKPSMVRAPSEAMHGPWWWRDGEQEGTVLRTSGTRRFGDECSGTAP